MKGLKKNLICSLLAAATVAGSVPAMAMIPADVVGTGFEEPIQVLAALEIMIGDGDGNFRPTDTITRAEVTKIAINAMGLEDAALSAAGQTKYPDVAADYWANGYINLATSMGLIIGDDKGNFRPFDSITYAEAMTIMVRAVGHEPSAIQKGGFPNGYLLVGSENGMGKNVSGSANEAITRGNAAYLTVNTLKTKMMEQTNFGDSPKYEVVDKTLLNDRLKVFEYTGQITAIPSSAINGESNLVEGQVRIDDKIYDTEYNVNKLLGYNVDYYVRKDSLGNESVILAMPIAEKNRQLTIKADLFDSVTEKNSNKAISYFKTENDSRTQTAELSPNATLIYNGKHNALEDQYLNMTDKAGEINLLDTDKDGKYDIVFVSDYYNMVVDTVSSSGKINDKYDAETITLDEDVTYTITRGLESLEVSDLKEYDVLSVAESLDGELFEILVTNQTVTGRITAVSDDEYTIDGKQYKVANNYTGELKIGTEATFYLDFEGKIAGTDTAVLLSSNYGYMLKAYEVTGDDVVKFRVFTKDGDEKVFEGAERIRLNGESAKADEEVLEDLGGDSVEAQLITYKLNSDGKISEINTAQDNTSSGDIDTGKFTLNYELSNAVYNASLGKLDNIRINKDTIIFDIPEDKKDLSIADISMFEDEQKYDVLVYDLSDDYTAKAIIVQNANLNANAESSIAVVKEVIQTQNSDDEITDMLVALIDGKEERIYAKDDSVLVKNVSEDLEAGDIIQIKKNSEDEIASINVLFDIKTKGTEGITNPAENLSIVYGKVTKKFTSSINVTVNDADTVNYSIPSDANIYKVDTELSKNKVTVAEAGDIQAYDAEEGNRVLIKLYKNEVKEIVIIQ